MENILFLNKDTYGKAEIKQISKNTIQILTEEELNISGFNLVTDNGDIYGEYEDYTTLYKKIDGGFILSNDGSVYIEPDIIIDFFASEGGILEGETRQIVKNYEDLVVPSPISNENYEFVRWHPEIPDSGLIEKNESYNAEFVYVPTLEEVQEKKIEEMNEFQQEVIQQGINVALTDGTVEHFTLTDHDQTSLMGLQTRVFAGDEHIPWHTSDEEEHCKFYSNADMALVTSTALSYVAWHVTYFRDLRIYIRSLETKEDVYAVTYGMNIPIEYQSEPLQVMIAAQS